MPAAGLASTSRPNALHRRLGSSLAELFQVLSQRLLQHKLQPALEELPILSRFSAVLIHDCTTLALLSQLAGQFPGCGNQHRREAAGLKLLVEWNALSGQVTAFCEAHERTADPVLAKALPDPPEGALVLCDRGFFDIEALQKWSTAKAFYVIRPITGLVVARDEPASSRPSRPAKLGAFLRRLPKEQMLFDGPVVITDQKHPCRLIAMRCPPEEAARRRRKMHQTCSRKGRTASRDQLTMCDWFVLLTNVPAERLTAVEAAVVYRVRWQIELLFKAYKSQGGLNASRARRGDCQLVEIRGKCVVRLLEHALLSSTSGPLQGAGWLQRIRHVVSWVETLMGAMLHIRRLKRVLSALIQSLCSLPNRRRRKKRPGTRELLECPHLIDQTLT